MVLGDDTVWFITGASSGFGHEIGRAVIDRGWRLVATARDTSAIEDLIALAPDRVFATALDVVDAKQIEDVAAAAEARFGRIDVLVNNAGYSYQASVEEGEDEKVRGLFETNVFGLLRVTQAALPVMRRQRRGHIFLMSSIAGILGAAGSGFYSATKHAVSGLGEALAEEVRPLGIKVTIIEPGPFRTDFGGRSQAMTRTQLADYRETVGKRAEALALLSGKQPGDPARAASVILDVANSLDPPLHLPLGRAAYDRIPPVFERRLSEMDQWRDIASATDYPA
ncbi:oxidoreductase [soil metagenome]